MSKTKKSASTPVSATAARSGVDAAAALYGLHISKHLRELRNVIERLLILAPAGGGRPTAFVGDNDLSFEVCDAIVRACHEIADGRHHEHFLVDMIQGGAGTSTNMNANEVIANRALELMGHAKGEYQHLHPLDDVNMSQSTNDVYPTAIRVAMHIGIARLLAAMAVLADKGADLPMAARTHGQHAVPATFGYKVAVWVDKMLRHVERFQQAAPRLFVAMLGGGAGTFASLGEHGPAVQAGIAKHLGFGQMNVPSRVIGDHLAENICILGLLAATCGKIGREIYTLMKTEFGEVEEPVPPGTVGSSTMPQKKVFFHIFSVSGKADQVFLAETQGTDAQSKKNKLLKLHDFSPVYYFRKFFRNDSCIEKFFH